MALVAAPAPLMTETAQGLLKAAADLGLPASVVTTTSDTHLGLGFEVPDEVAQMWIEGSTPKAPVVAMAVPDPAPESRPKVTGRRGPGKSTTTGEA